MPNFVVIGAAKCGTTSLYHYLKQHPQIFLPPVKEPEFFCFDGQSYDWRGPSDNEEIARCVTDLSSYTALFDSVQDEVAIGDVSRWYVFSERAAKRIRHHIPDCKLIAILRDPVDRAWSHFQHLRRQNTEPLESFADALGQEDERIRNGWGFIWRYFRRGLYYEQLKTYSSLFDRRQMLICFYEDFNRDPAAVCRSIFRFLGVDDQFVPDTTRRHNRTPGLPRYQMLERLLTSNSFLKRAITGILPQQVRNVACRASRWNLVKPAPSAAMRAQLVDKYRGDVVKLSQLVGRDLSTWLASK